MKKMHRKRVSLAVVQALSAGVIVGMAAPSAYAQTPPAPPPAPEKIEKLEVTGSRIPSANLESTSPVSTITATDIAFQNPISAENLLNQMPQVFADMGNMLSNGSTGTSAVDLRGLGSNRTLVLIDGKRLPAGSPFQYAADLNQVPIQLIQRVEILTGGASAVYGSDAVSGVVNFIMNDHFQGVQGDIGMSFYNHQQHNSMGAIVAARQATNPVQYQDPGDVDSDGQVNTYALTLGSDFADGKGNAVLFLGYQTQQPVLQATRDYSACAAATTNNVRTCGGSGTSYPGLFINLNNGNEYTIGAGNQLRPFTDNDEYNYAPLNYYQVPNRRYNVNAFAHYDITSWARVYAEFGFMDNIQESQVGPSGDFGNTATLTTANPLLNSSFLNTFGVTPSTPQQIIIARRNVEGGGRTQNFENEMFRTVVGVKGDVWGGWDYDLWYQYGRVTVSSSLGGYFSNAKLGNALNIVTGANGQAVCASGPPCVPYNIFQLGGVTPAALNYLEAPGIENGYTRQDIYGGTLTGDLGIYGVKSPWASSGVGVAFGIEHRTEQLSLNPDEELQTGDLAGTGGPTLPLNGQYSVNEVYGEFNLPIIEDMPYAKLLSVNGSARWSDYTTNQETTTYGLGLEWAPVNSVRLRASYQKAVRAANIVELFTQQGINLFSFTADPCAGPTPSATLQQCLRTGLPANLYGSTVLNNPAGQGNYLQGGNPNLDPEQAKTWTAGVVYTPSKNLSGSIDYFNIKVDNAIGRIAPAQALSQCITSGSLCDLIHRDPLAGTLWLNGGFISATNQNLVQLSTSGVDFNGNYTYPIDAWGSLGAQLTATYLKSLDTSPYPGAGSYNCAGYFGDTCGTPAPKWRFHLTGLWNTPWNWTLSATVRYFEGVSLDVTQSNPLLSAPFNSIDSTLASRTYLDLAASWNINKMFTLYFGVNNVCDKDPPIVTSDIAGPAFGNGNTYPQVYDSLGRRIFINLTAKF
jgi:iron complex outermembrane receptor protein